MDSTILGLIFVALFLAGATLLVFVWAVKGGQFEDIESVKYRMMEDDEENP